MKLDAESAPPPTPSVAEAIFGDRLPLAQAYVAHLADTGVSHGLIGPRERAGLWDRHVLNCAVMSDVLSPECTVADVGAGAGLPGIAVAIRRPDVHVTLVESMLRRVNWTQMVVDDLSLSNVTVLRSRAEEAVGVVEVDFVTSRAVARLDKLALWCLPLLRPTGSMVAIKGSRAQDEMAEAAPVFARFGARDPEVVECGAGLLDPPTIVIRAQLSGSARVRQPGSGRKLRPTSAARHKRSRR